MDDRKPVTLRSDQPERSERIARLVNAATQGSDAALAEIVAELSPLLWQVARAAGLNLSDAEDVLQTVWMRLLAHLDGIHTSEALTAWLVITTKREAWRGGGAGGRAVTGGH